MELYSSLHHVRLMRVKAVSSPSITLKYSGTCLGPNQRTMMELCEKTVNGEFPDYNVS